MKPGTTTQKRFEMYLAESPEFLRWTIEPNITKVFPDENSDPVVVPNNIQQNNACRLDAYRHLLSRQ